MREAVVLVHGIWMTGVEMALLRKRIQHCGYDVYQFHYPSLRRCPRSNAEALNDFVRNIKADVIHFVAHSLGGIVLMHLFNLPPKQKPGRVVMLGTPAKGSQVAKEVNQHPWLHFLLGESIKQGLLGDVPDWPMERELGLVVGSRRLGLGVVLTLGKLQKPNDGTVSLSETEIPEAKAVLNVDDSHFSMLADKQVASEICYFLQNGIF